MNKPKKDIDYDANYATVKCKRKTRINVGFEWEIPINIDFAERYYWEPNGPDDDEDYYQPDTLEYFSENYLWEPNSPLGWSNIDDLGFNAHFECGGYEVCSPVFHLLSTARMYAGWVKSEVLKSDALTGDERDLHRDNSCGIHVHVQSDMMRKVGYRNYRAVVVMMLNREENKSFIMKFSGRDRMLAEDYLHQAEVTGWDKGYDNATRMVEVNGYDTLELPGWVK